MQYLMRLVTVVSLLLVVVGIGNAQAQEEKWQFTRAAITTGRDALSSGISGNVRLMNGNTFVDGIVKAQNGWFGLGKVYSRNAFKAEVAYTAGHGFGEFWHGPCLYGEVSLVQLGGKPLTVSSMQWPFVFYREPEAWRIDGKEPNTEGMYQALYSDVSLGWGPMSVTYSYLDFLDDLPVSCIGVTYMHRLRKDFSLKSSITYNARTESLMYLVGMKWSKS